MLVAKAEQLVAEEAAKPAPLVQAQRQEVASIHPEQARHRPQHLYQ